MTDYTKLKEAFVKLADSGYNTYVIKQYIIPLIKNDKLDEGVIAYCKELEKFNSKVNYMPKYSKDLTPEKSRVQQAIEVVLKVYNKCIFDEASSQVGKSPSTPSM